MFSTLTKANFNYGVTFILLFANVVSSEWSEILLFCKALRYKFPFQLFQDRKKGQMYYESLTQTERNLRFMSPFWDQRSIPVRACSSLR